MKNLILIFLICTGSLPSSLAQTFEGTITYTNKSDIVLSDEQTIKMEKSKKQMEEQMNSPEFKKQMEQNPAIKEMMEKQLKMMESMEGGNSINFLPPKTVTKIKGKNTCTIMSESNVILYRGDENKTYSLDRTNKTYSDISTKGNNAPDPKVTVTETMDMALINGYKCVKYIITYDGSAEMSPWLWVTKDIKDIDPSQFGGSTKESMNWYFKGVDGFPVKIEINTPQGRMVSEMSELKRMKLPDSEFQIPPDYKKK